MTTFIHETVLLEEAVAGLHINPEGTYVDCTLGGAGHSSLIASKLNDKGHLYAFDQDYQAIVHAEEILHEDITTGKVTLVQDNFRNITDTLNRLGVYAVDGILYDLGISSPQVDDAERGFSYQQDAPLDMRMNQEQTLSAYTIVNEWDEKDLIRIFRRYGEEKFSRPIAKAIVKERKSQAIETTFQLVDLIKEGIPAPARRKGGHPAKRVFQAIRIAVNDELGALEDSLEQAVRLIDVGGRISVITFHSLEDRITKQLFKEYSTVETPPAGLPLLPEQIDDPPLKRVNKKAILPSEEEVAHNRRSRSAKLRIVEKQAKI